MRRPSQYDRGDLVRVSGVFTDLADALIDPSALAFKLKDPAGAIATLVHGVDAALVRESLGHYHVDCDASASGLWSWRWEATGTGQAADEGQFYVKPSRVLP